MWEFAKLQSWHCGQSDMNLPRNAATHAFAQVICSEDTLLALKKAQAQGTSTWRVSSTGFGHIASDQKLNPLGPFATPEATQDYPALDAGEFVQQELEAIGLNRPC